MGVTCPQHGSSCDRERAGRSKTSFPPEQQPLCKCSPSKQCRHRPHSPLHPVSLNSSLFQSEHPVAPATLCRDAQCSTGPAADTALPTCGTPSARGVSTGLLEDAGPRSSPLQCIWRTHQGSCCSLCCSLDLLLPRQTMNIPICTQQEQIFTADTGRCALRVL